MPPPSAIRLITSGLLKPCQIARLKGGMAPPTTGRAATSSAGPMDHCGKMPTTMHSSTSISIGTRIQRTGSCGSSGNRRAGGPRKTPTEKRSEYTTAKMPASVAATGRP